MRPSALTPEEMAHRSTVECLSGWSFLLLALGILFFTPATILAGVSAQHADMHLHRIGLIVFCVALTLIFVGTVVCCFWLKKADAGRQIRARRAAEARARAARMIGAPHPVNEALLTVPQDERMPLKASMPPSIYVQGTGSDPMDLSRKELIS